MLLRIKSRLSRLMQYSPALWGMLFIIAFIGNVDISMYETSRPHGGWLVLGSVCFAALKATLLCMLYAASRRHRILRLLAILFIIGFCILSLVNGIAYLSAGIGLSYNLWFLVEQTSWREFSEQAHGFIHKIPSILFPTGWLWILFPALYFWAMRFNPLKKGIWEQVILSIIGIIYFGYFAFVWGGMRAQHFAYGRVVQIVRQHRALTREIDKWREKRSTLVSPADAHSRHFASEISLVIGESVQRDHWSLYGYPLHTTPRIDALRDSLAIFNDALSPSIYTMHALPYILTFASDVPDSPSWLELPSVPQLFRALGYKVTWLSNQEGFNDADTPYGMITTEADRQEFVCGLTSSSTDAATLDERLLTARAKYPFGHPDTLQLNIFHLMGSHFDYALRYPHDRRPVTADMILSTASAKSRPWLTRDKAQTVADYDNSIAYTDSILSVLIAQTAANPRPAMLVYLSDHGEEVYDLHDNCGRSKQLNHVPMIVYLNAPYRRLHPEMADRLRGAVSRPISTSVLPHILLTLSGSDYPLYRPSEDPLSSAFIPRRRYVHD